MTVGRLLAEATSLELSMWQVFLTNREEHLRERRESDRIEAELTKRG